MNYKHHADRVKKLYGVTRLGVRMYRMYLAKYDPQAWFLTVAVRKDLGDV